MRTIGPMSYYDPLHISLLLFQALLFWMPRGTSGIVPHSAGAQVQRDRLLRRATLEATSLNERLLSATRRQDLTRPNAALEQPSPGSLDEEFDQASPTTEGTVALGASLGQVQHALGKDKEQLGDADEDGGGGSEDETVSEISEWNDVGDERSTARVEYNADRVRGQPEVPRIQRNLDDVQSSSGHHGGDSEDKFGSPHVDDLTRLGLDVMELHAGEESKQHDIGTPATLNQGIKQSATYKDENNIVTNNEKEIWKKAFEKSSTKQPRAKPGPIGLVREIHAPQDAELKARQHLTYMSHNNTITPAEADVWKEAIKKVFKNDPAKLAASLKAAERFRDGHENKANEQPSKGKGKGTSSNLKNIPLAMKSSSLMQHMQESQWIGSTLPHVRCETTKGNLLIELDPTHSPIGVKRFLALVSHDFFRNNAVFRAVKDFGIQFGISDDDNLNKRWDAAVQDEKMPESGEFLPFKRGAIIFAGNGANSRTTQIFIATRDLPQLGERPWETPIGRVVSGTEDVLTNLYTGYGESVDQNLLRRLGNNYLQNKFPRLDYVKDCKLI